MILNKNTEYSSSRVRESQTPDYSTFKQKATPVNKIESFLSPYDSPIASFRRQNQPTQSPYAAQNPVKEPVNNMDFSKSVPPSRPSFGVQNNQSSFNESVSGIDNGSKPFS